MVASFSISRKNAGRASLQPAARCPASSHPQLSTARAGCTSGWRLVVVADLFGGKTNWYSSTSRRDIPRLLAENESKQAAIVCTPAFGNFFIMTQSLWRLFHGKPILLAFPPSRAGRWAGVPCDQNGMRYQPLFGVELS